MQNRSKQSIKRRSISIAVLQSIWWQQSRNTHTHTHTDRLTQKARQRTHTHITLPFLNFLFFFLPSFKNTLSSLNQYSVFIVRIYSQERHFIYIASIYIGKNKQKNKQFFTFFFFTIFFSSFVQLSNRNAHIQRWQVDIKVSVLTITP